MTNQSYVGDIGTEIIADTEQDLSTATTTNLSVRKPDGTVVVYTGEVVDTTKVSYTTVEDDLDQSGKYRVNAVIAFSDWSGLGETASFEIRKAHS